MSDVPAAAWWLAAIVLVLGPRSERAGADADPPPRREHLRLVGAGLAAAGGGAVARLRNARGVVLEVQARQIGFMASVDLSGLRLKLAR